MQQSLISQSAGTVQSKLRERLDESAGVKGAALLEKLLTWQPAARPAASEALYHSFFTES